MSIGRIFSLVVALASCWPNAALAQPRDRPTGNASAMKGSSAVPVGGIRGMALLNLDLKVEPACWMSVERDRPEPVKCGGDIEAITTIVSDDDPESVQTVTFEEGKPLIEKVEGGPSSGRRYTVDY